MITYDGSALLEQEKIENENQQTMRDVEEIDGSDGLEGRSEGTSQTQTDSEQPTTETEEAGEANASSDETVIEDRKEDQAAEETGGTDSSVDWDEAAERHRDELAFRHQIASLENRITRNLQFEDELKGDIKATREGRKDLLASYNEFKNAGVQYRSKPEPARRETKAANDETIAASGDWRDIKTEDVAGNIKGLGKKKMDVLLHEFPTIGKLEDARGQASKEHKQFKDVLPKGFGEAIAGEIENAMMDRIAKFSNELIVTTIAATIGISSEVAVEIAEESEPSSEDFSDDDLVGHEDDDESEDAEIDRDIRDENKSEADLMDL